MDIGCIMNNFKKIEKKIKDKNGNFILKEMLAPVIISASRSTDIPALYSSWLVKALDRKYCIWYNPFNRKPTYVSFDETRAFVFWTKNPSKMIPLLNYFEKYSYYFQFTLNDYEKEGFEPNVGSLNERIEVFKTLSKIIGPDRVIWRFDPIILGPYIQPRDILFKIWNIGNKIKNCTKKLVFSFVDVSAYDKVRRNLLRTKYFSKDNILEAEATRQQIEEICDGLVKIINEWKSDGWNLTLATCAEEVDLASYGIEHNRCIDDVLMYKLFPDDDKLMKFIGAKKILDDKNDCKLMKIIGAKSSIEYKQNCKLKDKGQRKACGCITSKDIGSYNTCTHFCAYCYANASAEAVKKNILYYSSDNESIVSY